MANDLASFIPQVLAQGLVALREHCIMPRLVNREYSLTPGTKGSVVTVPIPSAVPLVSVTPAATPPSTQDSTDEERAITMDTWYDAPFHMSDSDLSKVKSGYVPTKITEAIKTVANAVDAHILANYKKIPTYVGTAATTPFNTTDGLLAAKLARVQANRQLMPMNDRRYVLDVDAEGNASMLPNFQDFSKSGDKEVVMEGTIGHKLGADWYMDQNIPTHTAGSITTGLIAKASTAQAVGLKDIVVTTAASTGAFSLKVGDVITIGSQVQTYVITADVVEASAATDETISIEPGLRVALTGSEAITVKASHVNNLLMHRDAFAFATRPLEDPGNVASQSVIDPISGVILRLELAREYKRTRWSFDILFGTQLIRPEYAVRIAG